MPSFEILASFVAAVVLLSVTPGPDFVLIVSRAIAQGRGMALLTVCGFGLAGLVQVPMVALGIGSIIAAYPALFDVIRVIGGGYLVWRGVRLLRARWVSAGSSPTVMRIDGWSAVREGFIASLTNPKGMLFMTALLPQFVDPIAGNESVQLLVLGMVMKVTAFVSEACLALGAGTLARGMRRHPYLMVWQERMAATVMIGIGIHLAVRS